MRPGAGDQELQESPNDSRKKELQIVDPTSSAFFSGFKLPDDWIVEKRPSPSNPGRVDKYYYNPGTGEQFRSLISVQRYLKGEPMKPVNERNMRIVPCNLKRSSMTKLPDNWVIQEKPRSSLKYAGVIDRHYIDSETGLRFRSLRAVERYLAEMNEDSIKLQELKAASQSTKSHSGKNHFLQIISKCPTNATAKKKYKSDEDGGPSTLESTSTPAKVKWVLSGPGGNMWKPFLGESEVPESVKQKWSQTFVLSIQD